MSFISESREINSSTRRRELQGPRPAALRVSSSSSTIKNSSHNHPNRSKLANPVVIYLRSPKIIHVRPEEFMSLVQRLTGKDSRTNEISYDPSSAPSSSSCDRVEDDDESMAAMMVKTGNLFDIAEMKKPFNEVDYGDHDQILGMSPTWLRFLACV
ncbi:hypothetical protein DITRI_Ditri06bG0032200 [Diplodiscus trichospermus]